MDFLSIYLSFFSSFFDLSSSKFLSLSLFVIITLYLSLLFLSLALSLLNLTLFIFLSTALVLSFSQLYVSLNLFCLSKAESHNSPFTILDGIFLLHQYTKKQLTKIMMIAPMMPHPRPMPSAGVSELLESPLETKKTSLI